MAYSLDAIHHTDCINALSEVPEGTVDLVFADPPFNIGYEYDVYDDAKDSQSYLSWSREWISAVRQVLKPNGTFWLAIGDEYAAELKVLSQELGFHCRSWVIWYYTFGVNCKKKFNRSHAHLFHFVVNPKEFTFNRKAVAVPSARQLVYADSRANPEGRLPDDTWVLRPQDCFGGLTPDEDTWYFPRVAGTFKERAGFHGCQMPEQLLGRIIRVSSNVGDIVLDPFSGSATTLAVAKKLDRHYLGFELSEDYVERGRNRLYSIETGDSLEGTPEPQISAPPTKSEPQHTVVKTSVTKPRRLETVKEKGVIKAFQKTYDGFSVDRVVADRDLNLEFLAECERIGVSGEPAELNRTLFRLRKAGKLVHVPTLHRTTYHWEECDAYLDASEIALSQMLRNGVPTLDEILCDPDSADEFDRIAARYAPRHKSLQYRWGALKLRKEAKKVRARSAELDRLSLDRQRQIPTNDLDPADVPDEPGIYLVYSGQRRVLFAGESLNLQNRLSRAFLTPENAQVWHESGDSLRVKFRAIDDLPKRSTQRALRLLAHQSHFVADKQPALNYLNLGAV